MSASEPLLRAEGRARTPTVTVAVDLRVGAGEIVGLVGPNGAGKSLTLHALLGLVDFTGRLEVCGRDLAAVPVHRRGLGWAPQTPALLPRRHALAQIAAFARPSSPLWDVAGADADAVARHLAGDLGLDPADRRRPGRLSGGEAQRVSVARAMAAARVLLLDEPTSAQDTAGANAIRHAVRRHVARGGAAVVVAHRPEDAHHIANRLVVLQDGEVAQIGTPAQLATAPATAYIGRVVGATVLEGEVRDGVLRGPWGQLTVASGTEDGPGIAVIRPASITLSTSAPGTSARNVIEVAVTAINTTADATTVTLAGSPDLVARITADAATGMGLTTGQRLWAAIKATDITVEPM